MSHTHRLLDARKPRRELLTVLPRSQVCQNALLNQPFVHAKVPVWASTIIENVLKELAVANGDAAKKGMQKFKYVGEALPA